MNTTYNLSQWGQPSVYHQERLSLVISQVDDYLLPKFLANVKKGPVSIADFACGEGTITCEFIKKIKNHGYDVKKVLLIDVVDENILIAIERVQEMFPNITVEQFKCNGHNFSDFDLEPVDFLYCWDAMVHFDIIDISGYLNTLKKVVNGIALFHHSNNNIVTQDIMHNTHHRNFMSSNFRKIFYKLFFD